MREANLELGLDCFDFSTFTPPIVHDDKKEGGESSKEGPDRLIIEELLKVQVSVLCGLTPELSRAEGVGLND